MRRAFVAALQNVATRDSRIVLLTADLGYQVVEEFARSLPDRFVNVGVAEHNLIGIATGMAEAGYLPFVYSIASFLTLRPYEAIRNGPLMHRLPIRLIGIGGGAEYGHQGLTHYAIEDLGVMRLQPEMIVIAPADARQAVSALEATWQVSSSVYYRLGKDETTQVPGLDGRFELGRVQVVRDGRDLLFLATGAIAGEAVAAAESLAACGVSAAVGIVATLNPAPIDLPGLLERFPVAVTVEAHYTVGGLGSLVSDAVADGGLRCRVVRAGFKHMPHGLSGSQEYCYREHGLTRAALYDAARVALGNIPASRI